MESIEKHIELDRKIAEDPLANPAARRHAKEELHELEVYAEHHNCLLYTSPSPRDRSSSRMPSSA